jgi:hypothetical protein
VRFSLRVAVIAFVLIVIVVFVFFPAAFVFIFVLVLFLFLLWLSSQKNIDSYHVVKRSEVRALWTYFVHAPNDTLRSLNKEVDAHGRGVAEFFPKDTTPSGV